MSRDDPHIRVRIPELLKQKLEDAAKRNNRSVTAELVSRLEQTFEHEGTWQETLESVAELYQRMEEAERWIDDLRNRTGEDMYNRPK